MFQGVRQYGNQGNNQQLLSQDDGGQQPTGYNPSSNSSKPPTLNIIPTTLQTCILVGEMNDLWGISFEQSPVLKVCGIVRKIVEAADEIRFLVDDGSATFPITYNSTASAALNPPKAHSCCVIIGSLRRLDTTCYLSALHFSECNPVELPYHLIDAAYNHLSRVQQNAVPPLTKLQLEFPSKNAATNTSIPIPEKRSAPSGGFVDEPSHKFINPGHNNNINQNFGFNNTGNSFMQPQQHQMHNPFIGGNPYSSNNNNNNQNNTFTSNSNNQYQSNSFDSYNKKDLEHQQPNLFLSYKSTHGSAHPLHDFLTQRRLSLPRGMLIPHDEVKAHCLKKGFILTPNEYDSVIEKLEKECDVVSDEAGFRFCCDE